MSKKYLLIGLVVIFVIVVALYFNSNKKGSPATPSPTGETTDVGGTIENPTSIGEEVTTTNNLPNGATNPSASAFKIGFNQPFSDPFFLNVLNDTAHFSQYRAVFSAYDVDNFRFPGGTIGNYYFWDDDCKVHAGGDNFGTAASKAYAQYKSTADAQTADKADGSGVISCQEDNFAKFLKFSSGAGLHPIVGLNTNYYHDANTIKEVTLLNNDNKSTPLPSSRWSVIDANIKAQVSYTHSLLGNSTVVKFEIGNETYASMSANNYGEIVEHYTNDVKSLYPQDQVLASFSKGRYQHGDGTADNEFSQWNHDLIAYLQKDNFLTKIDYFVIHYYRGGDTVDQTGKKSIDSRIQEPFFFGTMKDAKSYFPSNYTPKFSFTEFSPSQTTKNQNFNTQINAILMLDYLMKFHSDPTIVSVSKHTGINDKNGSFFTSAMRSQSGLSYIPASTPSDQPFAYIPPQTKSMAIFALGTGDKPIAPLTATNNYELLATQTGTTKYVQILNYETTPQTINISKYGNGTYATYTLPNLLDHFWDTQANKKTGVSTGGSITVPGHSFTNIVVTP